MPLPRVRIVLQARMGASRLPGKVLLPLAGIPLAVLCAKRASTTGRDVVVAIPEGSADDVLARTVAAHGLTICRGSATDVLSRFIRATADLDDNAIVVRLTADNPLPDGPFADAAVDALRESDGSYIGPEFGEGRLPHGLSAEAFRLSALRAIDNAAATAYEREHVTVVLRRQTTARLSPSALGLTSSQGRIECSIDRAADYVRLRNVFDLEQDPTHTPWRTLLDQVSASPVRGFQVSRRDMNGQPMGEMTLGTAQLGMAYGVANRSGQPDEATATDIVTTARLCGITSFDTARAYGRSEQILGRALLASSSVATPVQVVTKLAPAASAGVDVSGLARWARQAVAQSITELGRTNVDVLMLHRWQDRARDVIWQTLRALRSEGAIGALGASVQSPNEAIEALRDADIAHLQVPVNVFDWRWRAAEFLAAREQRPDVVIHGRSSLLQGLLTMDARDWPVRVPEAASATEVLARCVERFNRTSVIDLAFAYVRSLSWTDTIVVGAERPEQLIANVESFRRPPLTAADRQHIDEQLPRLPETILNPALWPLKPQ